MDLTDVTIPPMIVVGMAVTGPIIGKFTGWGFGVSFLAGLIPGAIVGLFCGFGLFIVISWFIAKSSAKKKTSRERTNA